MTSSSSGTHGSLPLGTKRQTIASTAALAKKWGLGFVNRHSASTSLSSLPSPAYPDSSANDRPGSSGASGSTTSLSEQKIALGSKSNPIGRGQPFPPIGQPLPMPKNNRMTWAGPLSMLGRKQSVSDAKLSSPSPASFSTLPSDGPHKPRESESPSPPTLPPRASLPALSPGMDDDSKSISLPRPVPKAKGPSRRRNNKSNGDVYGHGCDGSADNSGMLVIKAPDTDGDGDSLASMTSELEDRQATEGLGLGLSTNDLEDEPLGDMEGVEAAEPDLVESKNTESTSREEAEITTLPPASERKPSSHRLPTPIITSSPILPNTPGGIVSPASSTQYLTQDSLKTVSYTDTFIIAETFTVGEGVQGCREEDFHGRFAESGIGAYGREGRVGFLSMEKLQ